ncbi:outer membrane protein assembly factor BamB family protein [Natronobiforma cellulositropha]|uniref:outer membrane protein assembly factor BamB family protein n=1 Tax=Natronobiforma cellulositropha TaxID=1679076 RepID=UPI0021D5CEED|nr:PQQ-binding-like beta-propeller repeat protein [Natronobiforma cellulositropha]
MTGQSNDSSARLVFPRRTVLQAIAGGGILSSASQRTKDRVRSTLVPFPPDEQTTVHTASQTDHVIFVAETGFSVHRGGTLSLEWKQDLEAEGETVSACIHEDRLFVYASGGGAELRAYSIEAGEELWRVSSDEPRSDEGGKSLAGPVYSDGRVYGASASPAGGRLLVADAESGDLLETGPELDGELYAADGGVYALREPGTGPALSRLDADGSERWSATGYRLVPDLATAVDGTLYALTAGGDCCAFADDPEPAWCIALEDLLRARAGAGLTLEGVVEPPAVAESDTGDSLLSLEVATSLGPYILLVDHDGTITRAVAVDPDDEDVGESVYEF